jgi:predicted transcriptional regulator of viral defense system
MSSSLLIVNYLDEYDINVFSLDDVCRNINLPKHQVLSSLRNLIENGYLIRLQRELYAKSSFSNQNVIGYNLCKEGALAYWSALSFHGLTTQFPNAVYIQSPKRIMPKLIHGSSYFFIHTNVSKIGLLQKEGRGNNAFFVTSMEKTICDCFDRQDISSGWVELLKAFYKAKLNQDKLIEACILINNISVIKRLGYLTAITNKKGLTKFLKFAKSQVNTSYSLLDTESKPSNNFNKEWMLDLNVEESEILDSLINVY